MRKQPTDYMLGCTEGMQVMQSRLFLIFTLLVREVSSYLVN